MTDDGGEASILRTWVEEHTGVSVDSRSELRDTVIRLDDPVAIAPGQSAPGFIYRLERLAYPPARIGTRPG